MHLVKKRMYYMRNQVINIKTEVSDLCLKNWFTKVIGVGYKLKLAKVFTTFSVTRSKLKLTVFMVL